VQPYVASVEGHGERSMIWIDGEVTHAVRKAPRFPGDPESTAPAPVGDDERALAMRAIAAAREATGAAMLYGRVDLLRDEGGAPRVTELELIEPSLFFPTCAAGLRRYVAAVARLLGV
jgi:hypothetical protein